MALDDPVARVVHPGVACEFGQIAAHEGEVVILGQLPKGADAVCGFLVLKAAAQGVRGVGRIDDDPAVLHDLGGAAHQSRLRMGGMDDEVLAQDSAAAAL